jgi:hypothetical protein
MGPVELPIELPRTEAEWLEMLCPRNPEAQSFIQAWVRYCHEVDDIIDGERTSAEEILATFVVAMLVCSHPFYLRHIAELRGLAMCITNMYADSVAWEKSQIPWQHQFADCYRHAGNEMIMAVARLCGGWEHARKFSQSQRIVCWVNQHKAPGGAATMKGTYGGDR